MKLNRRQLTGAALLAAAAAPGASALQTSTTITHGPFLGHVGLDEIWIWARTARPGSFRILYGENKSALNQTSASAATTTLERDCSAWLRITGLKPGTRYHYRIEGATSPEHGGTFQTIPSPDQFRSPQNPRGLFNFSFQFGSCANQKTGGALGATLPLYKTMLNQHASRCLFAVMNGDWVYEEKRDYPVNEWLKQTGATALPRIAELAPSITGVWENYKLYLERGKNLAAWHRVMPGYVTPDDHEILNDVYGTGSAGVKTQQATFRDIALKGWYDYIAGSNPLATKQGIHFGRATLTGGSDILMDAAGGFSKLDLDQVSNLHIHWGGQTAGVPPGRNERQGDPNAGVYDIVERLDDTRLRIRPAPPATGAASYSVGRHNYGSFRAGNVEVYLLDTRGMRDMHDIKDPNHKGLFMLGRKQHDWLKKSMAASDADFFFLASTVNLTVPHMGSPTSTDVLEGKDDAWTAFLEEREDLIRFWDSLGKPVMVMTGDLHNSFAVKVTDTVWEFAAGPHNSQNHPATSEGNRPPNGRFDSRGRMVDIRWSSYIRTDVPPRLRYWPIYAVARVNNVFNNPTGEGVDRWVAYPKPHVVIQYYDGITGDLLYAEAVHTKEKPRA
jgi:alkaline phosphatase D